jgi:hypothetical protein
LWSPKDEQFYGSNESGVSNGGAGTSSGRWHYPANFDDAVEESGSSKKSQKKERKKDRWAMTKDAYSRSEETSRRKKSKKKKAKLNDSGDSIDGFPEDPEGGLYGRQNNPANKLNSQEVTDVFNHEL